MCLQCTADAQNVFRDKKPILPKTKYEKPVWLMQAVCGCDEWPRGWYGLVVCNDPFCIWEGTYTPEPKLLKGDKVSNKTWVEWFRKQDEACKIFDNLTLMTSYHLVQACIAAGYNQKTHGWNVNLWLLEYIAKQLKSRALATPKDWDPPAFEGQVKTRRALLKSAGFKKLYGIGKPK